jgi:hypothetical protein
MPQAVARPCRRDSAIALRATTIKLGPGLTAPTAKALAIATADQIASIEVLKNLGWAKQKTQITLRCGVPQATIQ